MSDEQDASAFPLHLHGDYGKGMTLRDYFAAAALTAIISKLPEDELAAICNGHCRAVGTPRGAYAFADAMIEARKEGS
jgi:hypothetical protein